MKSGMIFLGVGLGLLQYAIGTSLRTPYGQKLSIGRKIAGAGSGVLFEAKDAFTDEQYALKKIRKDPVRLILARNEIKVRNSLIKDNSSGLNDYLMIFENSWEDDQFVYILNESLPGGNLKQAMTKFDGGVHPLPESVAKKYIYQIARAIEFLHRHSIIHRDIKPDTVYIAQSGNIKLGDFTCTASGYDTTLLLSPCGGEPYMPPETLKDSGRSYEIDIWSLGVTSYYLLFGKLPFERTPVSDFRVEFPKYSAVSVTAKNLIRRMLVVDPFSRATLESVLAHTWFDEVREE